MILHEYGHAMQADQVPGFGDEEGEAGAIGEGFGDYWAVTVTQIVAGEGALDDPACVADWDSTSYTDGPVHCLRRVDGNKHYPEDADGDVHDDGEIWSRVLWGIRTALGATQADTLIVDAHFRFAPDTSFHDAALATIATAQQLYGNGAAKKVHDAFAARGFV